MICQLLPPHRLTLVCLSFAKFCRLHACSAVETSTLCLKQSISWHVTWLLLTPHWVTFLLLSLPKSVAGTVARPSCKKLSNYQLSRDSAPCNLMRYQLVACMTCSTDQVAAPCYDRMCQLLTQHRWTAAGMSFATFVGGVASECHCKGACHHCRQSPLQKLVRCHFVALVLCSTDKDYPKFLPNTTSGDALRVPLMSTTLSETLAFECGPGKYHCVNNKSSQDMSADDFTLSCYSKHVMCQNLLLTQ